MKGDIYYLRDNTGYISHKFVVDDDDFGFEGECYEGRAWDPDTLIPFEYDYVAGVCCKWDACSHWYFRGEDYNPDDKENEADSYYHLCGGYTFGNHIRAMCFVWKLAEQIISKQPRIIETGNVGYTHESYYEPEYVKQIVDIALKDCEIVKGESDGTEENM